MFGSLRNNQLAERQKMKAEAFASTVGKEGRSIQLGRFLSLSLLGCGLLSSCEMGSGDAVTPGGDGAAPVQDTNQGQVQAQATTPTTTPETAASQPAVQAAPTATPVAQNSGFQNPGGMWMPTQMLEHANTLRQLGLAYDPAALSQPTQFPLAAIVSLGGCSASFVSPEGLLITNHHCVTGALQYNSTADSNLLVDGYLAKSRADEKWAGPTQRVYVTTAFTDVTAQVMAGTESIQDDRERYKKIEDNRKQLKGKCEEGKKDKRCRIASYFEGAQFFQIEQLQIRDIRLVHAPHAGVGVYGGEIDNWRWPRHTGDYSFYRAYVGPDGQPADYSEKNVPYKPPFHLKVATGDLDEGDLVMVAGYPGRTQRFKTAGEVKEAMEWNYPRLIKRFDQYITLLETIAANDKALGIKAASTLRGLNNYITNFRGMLEGLSKGGLAAQKVQEEQALRTWIAADANRKGQYGGVLEAIDQLNAQAMQSRDKDSALGEILSGAELLRRAMTLVSLAEEREKPDAERRAGMQDKDLPNMLLRLEASDKRYDRNLDEPKFRLALARVAALPATQRPGAFTEIVGTDASDAQIVQQVSKLYEESKLGDLETMKKLMKTINKKKLAKSKDAFVQLAIRLKPQADEMNQRQEARAGAMAKLRPRYVAAMRAYHGQQGKSLAPDANSTLRITYGTVRGYRPNPQAQPYFPFTKISEMVAKHTDKEPFDAPDNVLQAVQSERFGTYVDPEVGEVPVDFLADLDITGGNSGSPTLNARGELIGLVFDGNYEAMASDWVFMPEITRSIHVDIRYVLWMMDVVDGADHLLQEMGVPPQYN